jgi:hypothetical protein
MVGMLVVHRLAGVLLEMHAVMPTSNVEPSSQLDLDLPLADDRMLELADLIALRQIGVEIVLPVEHATIC